MGMTMTQKILSKHAGVSPVEAGQLIDGLQTVLDDLESGALPIDPACEDIHMFVEQVLTERRRVDDRF